MAEADPTANFCKPFTDEQVEGFRRDWQRYWDEQRALRPKPLPMGNVALALDLVGDGIREFEFQDTVYQLKPTPYTSALLLFQTSELLVKLEAIGQLIEEDQMSALRDCYAAIADLGGDLITPKPASNPFRENGRPNDLARLFHFLVDMGNEMPIPETDEDGTPRRYNAAHHLMVYRAVYGTPTTWRAFCAGCACIERQEAEQTLRFYDTMTVAQWGTQEGRVQMERELKRAAGMR
jgi:hypothetical protein